MSSDAPAAHSSLVVPSGHVSPQRVRSHKGGGGGGDTPPCSGVCYSPSQIQAAYDFPTGKNALDGTGQTILIVVPYGSDTLAADVATFDSTFGIAPLQSLTIVNGPSAVGVGSGDTVDWGVETSVGVEYAHALAPAAKIVVAVSPTDDTDDVTATEAQILPQFPGAIVSQSFGDDETDPSAQADFQTLHTVFAAATAAGGTILAGAGDYGAADCPDPSYGCGDSTVASYPASDPLVTGVGGTEGNPYPGGLLNSHGQYGGEQVWNESDTFGAATGGAPSIFPAPAYQQGITGSTVRDVPDVSINAAINGGIQFYFDPIGFQTFGGTSAGPPQWAAIIAIADQARAQHHLAPLGNANTALYGIASNHSEYQHDFHDITVGTNAIGTMPGYTAGPGYDLASGLGTPDVSRLVQDLGSFQPPPPQNVTCSNQQLTGTYHDVNVPKGAWCDLSGATVLGNFHADQASGIGITGSTINGDAQINHTTGATDPSHPGTNVICGSTIGHDLQVQGSNPGVAWTIGGQGCGNTITHDAHVQDNAGPLTFSNNTVGHDLHVQNNRAGAVVSGNQVSHDLQCQGNSSVSGVGNTAGGHAQGQCSTASAGGGTSGGSGDL